MSMSLEKTTQSARTDYNGTESYVLPAGSEIKCKMKIPGGGWDKFMETEVPKGKKWNFVVTIVAHEFDE